MSSLEPDLKAYEGPVMFFLHDFNVPAHADEDKPFAMRASGHTPLAARRVVEPDGVEPTTSCLQSRRSTN